MEKAYKFLKGGEDTQKGDEFFNIRANCWFKITGSFTVGICHSPIRREINVIEIPAIPDGFRELTQEDIDNNTKGEVYFLNRYCEKLIWERGKGSTKYFSISNHIKLIIKPAPKGLRRENYKHEMKLRAKESKEFDSRINSNFDGVMFYSVSVGASFEELNKNYQIFDERKQAWIDCAEYEG